MFNCKISDEAELRIFEERHTEKLFTLINRNKEHISRWSAWLTNTHSLKDTRDLIKQSLAQFAAGNGFQAGIWCDDDIVGQIGFNHVNWPDRFTEVGYWLAASYQGKGLITNAARILVNYAFFELKLNRVEMHCPTDNPRSRAIPEKLGFTLEGVRRQAYLLHNQFIDLALYAMLAKDWPASNR